MFFKLFIHELFYWFRSSKIYAGLHYMKPFQGMDINALCRHSDETDTCGQVRPRMRSLEAQNHVYVQHIGVCVESGLHMVLLYKVRSADCTLIDIYFAGAVG